MGLIEEDFSITLFFFYEIRKQLTNLQFFSQKI